MNKIELLADLSSRDWCDFIGTPELLETKPDGTKWYSINVREIVGSNVGTYRNIHFYVSGEGGPSEAAFYKDNDPISESNDRELYRWMLNSVDSAPNNFKAVQVHWVSERWKMIVYSILEDDGASGFKWQTYYVRQNNGAPVKISNHESWRLISLFRV